MLNDKGFSILEVVVAAAMSLMVFLGFASFSTQMYKELKYSSQRADALEFRNAVSGLMSDLNTCSCQLNENLSPLDMTGTSPEASMMALKNSCAASSTVFAAPGKVVTGSNNQLTLSKIQLIKVEPLGTPEKFRGRLNFEYKSENLLRAIPSFSIEIRFTTDSASPMSAKKIKSCEFSGGSGGMASGSCPPGQFVTGVSAGAVLCSGVAIAGKVSNGSSGTPTTPGPGCIGAACVTADFGPCTGSGCLTNGGSCAGEKCTACGSGSTCKGASCCASPTCSGCSYFQ